MKLGIRQLNMQFSRAPDCSSTLRLHCQTLSLADMEKRRSKRKFHLEQAQ